MSSMTYTWSKALVVEMFQIECVEHILLKKNQTVDKENICQGSLLKEYEEHKAVKTTGTRISTKSKVNDVTQTLKPSRMSKMEGFAMSGMHGAAKNHQQCCSKIHSAIHTKSTRNFSHLCISEEATGDPDVKMHKVSNSLTDLEMLLCKWKSGDIYWRQMENEEFEELHREQNKKLNSGQKCTCTRSPDDNDENPPPRRHKAKKCTHADENDKNLSPRHHKKTYKSLLSVDTDADTNNNNNNVNTDINTQLEPSASLTTNDNELTSLSGTEKLIVKVFRTIVALWVQQAVEGLMLMLIGMDSGSLVLTLKERLTLALSKGGGENKEEDGIGMLNIEVEQR
ncbi:uncharacterized protein BJ212DRAFT_1305035 [Suillus subaureus]|uniref:Uncharacterized protein n=1 Tax=Suillus subaureus TaxID=48587 RepID=A0A9P7DSH3_9AGAM|nr:uncharacterized protein BJ212DRAFT_1305035 [Suillus subaureus]KAG1801745.1 hypothetical protein BJ212DRAFT_1305035 [Suillus subaureus]